MYSLEVSDMGRKMRTIVRAADAELAWQNVGYYNNAVNEHVYFQHTDASGMSYRTARADATVIGNSGTEGAAAELDPLGGNVGTFTPYFQFNTSPIEPAKPTLQNMTEFSQFSVNGQQMQMLMDGIEVPFWMGMTALNNGSAIPASLAQYQNLPGFRFESVGLGMFRGTVFEKVSMPNVNWGGDGTITVNETTDIWLPKEVSFYFPTSWNLINDYEIVPLPSKQEVLDRVNTGDCNNFINRLISKAEELQFKNIKSKVTKTGVSPTSSNRIERQDGVSLINSAFDQNVISLVPDLKTEDGYGVGGLNTGNFYQKTSKIQVNAGGVVTRFDYGPQLFKKVIDIARRSVHEQYVTTIIHESIHSSGKYGLSDKILAAAVFALGESDKAVNLNKKDSGDTRAILNYSGAWDAVLRKYCGTESERKP